MRNDKSVNSIGNAVDYTVVIVLIYILLNIGSPSMFDCIKIYLLKSRTDIQNVIAENISDENK